MSNWGEFWHHPKFRDVTMEIVRKFYIKEKDTWSLKVRWWHKRGYMLSDAYRIALSNDKVKEFTRKGTLL